MVTKAENYRERHYRVQIYLRRIIKNDIDNYEVYEKA